MNDYKELIDTLKKLSNKPETYQALFYTAADAIEQLVKERDTLTKKLKAYSKCFKIERTDDERRNIAVFKMGYDAINSAASELDIILAVAYGIAEIIEFERR